MKVKTGRLKTIHSKIGKFRGFCKVKPSQKQFFWNDTKVFSNVIIYNKYIT